MLHPVGIYMTSITKMDGTMNMKHLKALQHVSIIIQIIFRDFVSSLLKSLNLKYKNEKGRSTVVLQQLMLNCTDITQNTYIQS